MSSKIFLLLSISDRLQGRNVAGTGVYRAAVIAPVLAAAWAAEPVQAEAVTQPAAARAEAGKNVYRKNS